MKVVNSALLPPEHCQIAALRLDDLKLIARIGVNDAADNEVRLESLSARIVASASPVPGPSQCAG